MEFPAFSQRNWITVIALMFLGASSGMAFTNGQNASYVLGEPSFYGATHAYTQNGVAFPSDVVYDPTRQWYFVLDNGRVLIYDVSQGITSGMNATWVLGQQNFTSAVFTTTQNGMTADHTNSPGLAYDSVNHRLFVADNTNVPSARVLVYDLSVLSNISNGMNASWVLGQPDFTSTSANPTSANTFSIAEGLAYDPVNQRLFVADSGNNRVVVFDFILSGGIANNMNASYVLGQVDFTSNVSATTQNGMNNPGAVTYDAVHQRLFVSDIMNSRVLMFDFSSSGILNGGMNAAAVLGQPDFTSNGNACTSNSFMPGNGGIAYDPINQRLFVSSNSQKRVLIFDLSQPITNGMNAINVLGEPDFITCGPSASGPNRLGAAVGMTYDLTHQRLLVTDYTVGRVMIWTDLVLPPPPVWCNGQNASAVLGQANFTANTVGSVNQQSIGTASDDETAAFPYDEAYDSVNQRLFVVDDGGDRVLVFDLSTGVTNDMNAEYVLGQPDFSSHGSATTQGGMSGPMGVSYDPVFQRLYVTDMYRILVFNLSGGITNGMNASYVLGQPNFTSQITAGTPSQNITGIYPMGVTIDPATQRLYVADTDNFRVLMYDLSGGITNGMNATNVIGEPDFNTKLSQTTQNGFNWPRAVAVDPVGQRLFVGDSGRVLVFNLPINNGYGGIVNGMPAANVLGEPNFTSLVSGAVSQNNFVVDSLSYDPSYQQLFVSDWSKRVLRFDLSGGITNDMNASDVFGQPNFNSYGFAISQNGMGDPLGVAAYDPVNQRFFARDYTRVLMFSSGQGCVGGSGNSGGNGPSGGGLPAGCGSSTMICGSVSAADSAGTYLSGVPIQLRDWQGNLVTTTKSISSGAYSFGPNGLTASSTYYVVPIVGPAQSAVPLSYPIANLSTLGMTANLQIIGWPAIIQAGGISPGSYILVSTAVYNGSYPPAITSMGSSSGVYYSSSFGLDGTASVPVPTGSSYYLTYWTSQISGSTVTYNRVPSSGSTALGTQVVPGQVIPISNP